MTSCRYAGAQRLIKVQDLHKEQPSSSLIAEMQMSWCRDTSLFPPKTLTISESHPEMYLVSISPRILIVENLLNIRECDRIMCLAKPNVKRSRVSTGEFRKKIAFKPEFFLHVVNFVFADVVWNKSSAC